jgi:hypothetical protein
LNEVLDNPDLIPEFKNYKVDREKYSIEDVTSFPIANAVTDARKSKKCNNLDTYSNQNGFYQSQCRKIC